MATAETGPSPELIDMTRRFWVGAVLAVPVVILEMGGHLPGLDLHRYIVPRAFRCGCSSRFATPVVLWAGWPFFERGWASVRNRALNMFSLIALGVGAAYLYSLGGHLRAGPLPGGAPAGATASSAVYYEAAAVITVLVLLGQVLELRAREQTGGAIRALLNLAPKTARRSRDGRHRRGSAARSRCMSATGCASGPATACRWTAWCWRAGAPSMSRWSPASRCRSRRSRSAKLIGGTINGTGALVMRAEKVGADTVLARIVAHGRGGAAQPRADPAAGRSSSRPGSCRR